MHSELFFCFLYLTIFITISASQDDSYESYSFCSPSKCGTIDDIIYPFGIKGPHENCSYPGFTLDCNGDIPEITIGSKIYHVKEIDHDNQALTIVDPDIIGKNCPPPLRNSTLNNFSIFDYALDTVNLTLYYNCTHPITNTGFPLQTFPCLTSSNKYSYYMIHPVPLPSLYRGGCQVSFFPIPDSAVSRLGENLTHFEDVMKDGFYVSWLVDSGNCYHCVVSGGNCGYNQNKPEQPLCYCSGKAYPEAYTCPPPSTTTPLPPTPRKPNVRKKIIIGVSAAIGGCLVTCVVAYLLYRKKHPTSTSSKLISRAISSDPSTKSELGNCKSLLPTHVFDYKELEEATNNFDPSKELGEGGFGTVYYGKLYDGRSVAVKRLYENFRRMEQFMNEIEILSRLRHPNLVALYGCTSRHSRELLLVYEFVPNGTVADHLHGGRAKAGALTWPIRMSIAIETADALAHLHAVEIIHRDVKTNNILLDNNFRVKVADFGLSRLFPMDKTHVSTAPQGTPGYVDPDYHRCYQLTDKSDVFSFGVVLFELISSIPAVDITRHRHEINLSNMAINKIHNNALHELVDPSLGFESDIAARRSITLVAELAYRCLHDDKEMRPYMEEVLKVLQEINSSEYNVDKAEVLDIPSDDVVLLNKTTLRSPDSVTAPWISRDTTPNASG